LVSGLGLPALGTFTSETYSILRPQTHTALGCTFTCFDLLFLNRDDADVQRWQIPRRVSAYG